MSVRLTEHIVKTPGLNHWNQFMRFLAHSTPFCSCYKVFIYYSNIQICLRLN